MNYLVFAQLVPGLAAVPVRVESETSMCAEPRNETPVVMASLLLDERVDAVPKSE